MGTRVAPQHGDALRLAKRHGGTGGMKVQRSATSAMKAYGDCARGFSQLKLPLRFPPPQAAPNLEPQERVRPTDQAPHLPPI